MTAGIHDFKIPHEFMRPTRDMIAVRIPRPPEKIGAIHVPDMFKDIAQYNVMVGLVTNMGPLAFSYKNGDGTLSKQEVNKGDWVAFRPYAGTFMQGGQVVGAGDYRYLSSFNDVIGVIPGDKMPDPATLLWGNEEKKPASDPTQNDFNFDSRKPVEGALTD